MTMNLTAMEYEKARGPLTEIVESVPPTGWGASSPCEGWSALDVLKHLIGTQREFFAGRGVELGDGPDVDADPAAAWRSHAERVQEALGDDAVPATEYDGHFGRTTVGDTVQRFYVFDMIVHRWDIARAVGLDTGFSDSELDRIEPGIESFGEAIYMEGVCKPGVEAPAGADRSTRLLARLGRQA
jgi:uncharacterized protein (TIGR03086 family)